MGPPPVASSRLFSRTDKAVDTSYSEKIAPPATITMFCRHGEKRVRVGLAERVCGPAHDNREGIALPQTLLSQVPQETNTTASPSQIHAYDGA